MNAGSQVGRRGPSTVWRMDPTLLTVLVILAIIALIVVIVRGRL